MKKGISESILKECLKTDKQYFFQRNSLKQRSIEKKSSVLKQSLHNINSYEKPPTQSILNSSQVIVPSARKSSSSCYDYSQQLNNPSNQINKESVIRIRKLIETAKSRHYGKEKIKLDEKLYQEKYKQFENIEALIKRKSQILQLSLSMKIDELPKEEDNSILQVNFSEVLERRKQQIAKYDGVDYIQSVVDDIIIIAPQIPLFQDRSRAYIPKITDEEKRRIKREELFQAQQIIDIKNKSEKVLGLVRLASKRIFNIKEDSIKREYVKNQVKQQSKSIVTLYLFEEKMTIKSQPKKKGLKLKQQIVEEEIQDQEQEEEQDNFSLKSLNSPIFMLPKINQPGRCSQTMDEMTFKEQSPEAKNISKIETLKEKERIGNLISSLKTLKRQQNNQRVKLNKFLKEETKYFSSLDEITKDRSIKDILQGLLGKMSHNEDRNFYQNVQKSMKMQIL